MFVYVIHDEKADLCKIGFSKDPMHRLKSLQTGHSSTLRLLSCFHGGPGLEGQLHAKFNAQRVRGEWYRVAPADIERALVEARYPAPPAPPAPRDDLFARMKALQAKREAQPQEAHAAPTVALTGPGGLTQRLMAAQAEQAQVKPPRTRFVLSEWRARRNRQPPDESNR